jgi:hypothetical protein
MTRRCEPLHTPLPLAGRLGGVVYSGVEGAVLPVFYARQDLSFGCPGAFQLIGHEDPGNVLASCEELAEERFGGRLMTVPLHQDIQRTAVLIHRPPQIMASALNREKHRMGGRAGFV